MIARKLFFNPRILYFLMIGLAWGGLQACGYLPLNATPDYSEEIMIPVFKNKTLEPALEGKLTRRVKQKLLSRGGFKISQNAATARYILKGQITGYGLSSLSFNGPFQVAENRVKISAEIQVHTPGNKKPHWDLGTIHGTSEFVVDPDPGISRSAQELAIEEALERIAEEIWIELVQRSLDKEYEISGIPTTD